jgi:hypothetical protein
MNIIKTDIPDVLIFEPRVFGDARGFFFESFSSKVFDEAVGRHVEFVQDNHSQSQKGVLRGLHYQLDPHPGQTGALYGRGSVRCGGGYPSFIANLWPVGRGGAECGKQTSAVDPGRVCAWIYGAERDGAVCL